MPRVPQSLEELRRLPPPKPTAIVEFIANDNRFHIKAGDQFEAYPYVMDPSAKWTLVRRVSDGFDPGCNAYRTQVQLVRKI